MKKITKWVCRLCSLVIDRWPPPEQHLKKNTPLTRGALMNEKNICSATHKDWIQLFENGDSD